MNILENSMGRQNPCQFQFFLVYKIFFLLILLILPHKNSIKPWTLHQFWILKLFWTKIRQEFTCFHEEKLLWSFSTRIPTFWILELLFSTTIRLVFTWNCFALQQDPKVLDSKTFLNQNSTGIHLFSRGETALIFFHQDPNVLDSRTSFFNHNSTCFHLKLLCSSLWCTFWITFSPFGCKRRRKN